MELEAVYSYLYLHNGEKREGAPPGVAIETPSVGKVARGRNRDTLFVHLTLGSREPASATLYRGVSEALANAYFLSGGSVTAALRQAIRTANEYLMRHNTRVQGVDKQRGAVTCVVLRAEEIFIAQAGVSLAFLAHQGRLERLPLRDPGHVTPLGMSYGVDTRFYHSWIHPGDVLLMSEPGFSKHSDEVVGAAVIYEGVTAGIKNLAQMIEGDTDARLMLVEFSAGPRVRPMPEEEPQPEPVAEPPLAAPVPEPVGASVAPQPETTLPSSPPPAEPSRPSIEVDVEGGTRRLASGLALGLARLTGGLGQVLERLFGQNGSTRQATKKDQGPSPIALGLFAVLIPILVTLIVLAVYMQRGRAAQFQELLLEMEGESRLAQDASGDPATARVHWERVLELAGEATQLRPSHETVRQFRGQAGDALDVLGEVTRLAVTSLYEYQAGGNPSSLVVQSLAVYVLDSDVDYAYKHLLESDLSPADDLGPETLLFKNQAVGGDAVGELVDVVWFPKSGEIREDTAAILDTTGLLLNYRPSWGDVVSSRLATPAAWSNPTAIAVYGDNFYVLDPGAGVIWKYNAQGGGYPDEPTTYVFLDNEDGDPANDVNLAQVVDMTIDREGHLYLLGSDGTVGKFFGGEHRSFVLDDLEEPLVAPTSIFCSLTGLNPFCYIADPGSGRIVQTTPQGLFWAQYRARGADLADPFAQIKDIYVLETPLMRIYATSGNKLLVASLE